MTKRETFFVIDRDLIIVEALVTGPRRTITAQFVLDTGSAITTVVPELAESVGYSARDGFVRTRVHTAIGSEAGYGLRVAQLTVLGFTMSKFPVNVFDLGHDDIDGLLGMNFLCDFNVELRPAERRLLVEQIVPWPR